MHLNGIFKLSEFLSQQSIGTPASKKALSPEERPPRLSFAVSGKPKTGKPGKRIPVPQGSAVCFNFFFSKKVSNFNMLWSSDCDSDSAEY